MKCSNILCCCYVLMQIYKNYGIGLHNSESFIMLHYKSHVNAGFKGFHNRFEMVSCLLIGFVSYEVLCVNAVEKNYRFYVFHNRFGMC